MCWTGYNSARGTWTSSILGRGRRDVASMMRSAGEAVSRSAPCRVRLMSGRGEVSSRTTGAARGLSQPVGIVAHGRGRSRLRDPAGKVHAVRGKPLGGIAATWRVLCQAWPSRVRPRISCRQVRIRNAKPRNDHALNVLHCAGFGRPIRDRSPSCGEIQCTLRLARWVAKGLPSSRASRAVVSEANRDVAEEIVGAGRTRRLECRKRQHVCRLCRLPAIAR